MVESMPKEYKIIKVPPGETSAKTLNDAAAEGWEVSHCVATVGVLCYTLVREVVEEVKPTRGRTRKAKPLSEPLSEESDPPTPPEEFVRPEGLKPIPEGKVSTEAEVDKILSGIRNQFVEGVRISKKTGLPVRKYTKKLQ